LQKFINNETSIILISIVPVTRKHCKSILVHSLIAFIFAHWAGLSQMDLELRKGLHVCPTLQHLGIYEYAQLIAEIMFFFRQNHNLVQALF